MRIQIKLFLLLLVIAILPLAALSLRGERSTENLGRALADYGKAAVTEGLQTQLRQAVGYSSDLLAAQQRQVELALRFQASELERRLAQPIPQSAERPATYLHTAFDSPQTWPPGTEPASDHARLSPEHERRPFPISRAHQAFLLPDGLDPDDAQDAMTRLASMDQVYRTLSEASPGLFFWQYSTLSNGVHSAYPGHGGYPVGYDPRKRAWFQAASTSRDLDWTAPTVDASTRRPLLTAAMPLLGSDGEVRAVTAIDIDILSILDGVHGRLHLGANAESYIIQVGTRDGSPIAEGQAVHGAVVNVIASTLEKDAGRAWDAAPATGVLFPDPGYDLDALAADLLSGREGVRQMPHAGRDAFWVYGRLERLGWALLYVVPVGDLERIADRTQEALRQTVVDQIQLAGIATAALIVLVAVLAMLAARSVTGPLRRLAVAAQELARGNLETRVPVMGRDEVGQLAAAFNAMVPDLRSHIRVKESLDLAREVQQGLLPDEPPDVPGLDIFGRSLYSEAVGGDYYDFIPLKDEDGRRRIAISVGDVSGHGVVAALTMMSVRALLRSHAGDGLALRPVMRAVNRHLAADASGGRFVTLVYMVIDPSTRDVRWISAGHGPILFYDADAKRFEELAVHDIPLGVRADWPFHENDRGTWPDFGVIVLGTDGIWEARNDQGATFGKDGLMRAIEESANLTAHEICDHVVARLSAFAGAAPQHDDVTLVVIKFLPKRA